MRFSAPTTTLVFLGLATLAATTTTSTGNETCTPHNWLKYHVASSFWAAASAAFDLSDAAPVTTALDLTCVGGLLAPTAKRTFVDLEGMGFMSNATAQPLAATITPSYAAFAVPAVTAMATPINSTEKVESSSSSSSFPPQAILWYDMGFRYPFARPKGVKAPRRRVAKGALQAMMAAALVEVKAFIVEQLRVWGLKMLVASALFAAPWKTGIDAFTHVYDIVIAYAPMLLTGLLCVYTAIVFLIAVGGMYVICSNTCWHLKENTSASRPGLETVLDGEGEIEEEETEEEEDWVIVEAEEESDECNIQAPEEDLGGLSVFSLVCLVLSVAGFFAILAVFLLLGAMLSFIECIVRVTSKATSTEEVEEEEEEMDLLLDGFLGDFAPVLPGLALAGLWELVSRIRPFLTKEAIFAQAAAAMDAIATFEHSIQPLYEDCVNLTWYVLAGLALLAAAFVVLLARVALWTIIKVMGTFVAEEEGEEEVGTGTYPNFLPLAYLAAVLAIPGAFWVAGTIFIIYLCLPDGSKEELLPHSANYDGSGTDTERFRSESGLPSAARWGLQRFSVSVGGWRTSSAEALEKEEGGEVMADGC